MYPEIRTEQSPRFDALLNDVPRHHISNVGISTDISSPGGIALVPESLYGLPAVVPLVWLVAAGGWIAVAAGLRRGLSGQARRAALIAHVMTAPGVVLVCATPGFGFLYATVALTAEWWALIVATRLRPERLVASGSPSRLAVWSALAAVALLGGTQLVHLAPPG